MQIIVTIEVEKDNERICYKRCRGYFDNCPGSGFRVKNRCPKCLDAEEELRMITEQLEAVLKREQDECGD